MFPAYQEDEVIIDSVKSFLSQEYSKGLYDIIVISNQMRQETIDNLKTLSAKVVEMNSPQSTKIEALKEAIHYIEERDIKYDNVVILDADNVVNQTISRK